MRVLLLGADTPVGHSLGAFITPLRRHELVPVPLDATRWKRERLVKKALRRDPCDLVLDARLITLIEGRDPLGQPELERTRWLADLCARDGITHLHLSSCKVFSGHLGRPYRESDTPDAVDDVGRTLVEAERILLDTLEHSLILRLGKVFSGRGPTALSRLLDRLRRREPIRTSDSLRDSPVHTAEVARVVAGILDQISVGASNRGVYHYCSQGDTGYFAFTEAVVACASQFEAFRDARDALVEDTAEDLPAFNRALDCTLIRHEFGIQQLHWRDFIERAIRRYLELTAREETA